MTTQTKTTHTPGPWKVLHHDGARHDGDRGVYGPKGELIMEYGIYEKKDQFALHGIFDSLERAERHIKENIPVYVARSYFTDKTLTADSFEILPYPRKRSGSL